MLDIKYPGCNLPTYMIVMKDNKLSEQYANYCLPEWKKNGYDPQIYDAVTPDTLHNYNYLRWSKNKSAKYTEAGYLKEFTPTEKSARYSHTELWKKAIDLNSPILILEHDSWPLAPEKIFWRGEDYLTLGTVGTECYIITPKFAKFILEEYNPVFPIDLGNLGYIWHLEFWKSQKKQWLTPRELEVVVLSSSSWRPFATQAIDYNRGFLIDHYTGTRAEKDFGSDPTTLKERRAGQNHIVNLPIDQ